MKYSEELFKKEYKEYINKRIDDNIQTYMELEEMTRLEAINHLLLIIINSHTKDDNHVELVERLEFLKKQIEIIKNF